MSTENEIASTLNGILQARTNKQELLDEFTKLHRTHQQMTGAVILDLVRSLGLLYGGPNRSRYFDGRNEHLGKICFEINNLMENKRHDMWHKLPVI